MAQMHTLVLNGQTYQVTDKDAVHHTAQSLTEAQKNQARENIGACDWQTVVDKLCPDFSESGEVVTCTPVEGYPLEVISHIALQQPGSGDPSPTNIRPITGHRGILLNCENYLGIVDYDIQFDQTVYCGTFNWSTGVLTLTWACMIVEQLSKLGSAGYGQIVLGTGVIDYDGKKVPVKSSHYKEGNWDVSYPNYHAYAPNGNSISITDRTHFTSLEAANAYFAEQKAAGTPVQLYYKLKTPITVQTRSQEIRGLAGTNSIYSNIGDTNEVRGKADPSAVIQDLYSKVNAMSATLTALTGV